MADDTLESTKQNRSVEKVGQTDEREDSASHRFLEELRNSNNGQSPATGLARVETAPASDSSSVLPRLSLIGAEDAKEGVGRASDGGAPSKEEQDKVIKAYEDAKKETKGWDGEESPSDKEIKEKIGDKQIVTWGDNHNEEDSTKRLKNALDGLIDAGVNTIALEGFRENQQTLINDWLHSDDADGKLETQIREYMKSELGADSKYIDKMMDLLKAAKDKHMNLLCIEPDGAKMTGNGTGTDMDREGNWKPVIDKYLEKNPESKVLVFGGSSHFTSLGKFVASEKDKIADLTPPSQYKPDGVRKA